MSDGSEPVADHEILYRRIPATSGFYDPDVDPLPSPLALLLPAATFRRTSAQKTSRKPLAIIGLQSRDDCRMLEPLIAAGFVASCGQQFGEPRLVPHATQIIVAKEMLA